jgi:hypothetical protein
VDVAKAAERASDHLVGVRSARSVPLTR